RYRWAYGGFQILRKHWRHLLPGGGGLTPEQKREFAVGWLNWLGAESIGVAVAILNLVWVPVVAFAGIAIPDKVLTIPILAAFAVTFAHFVALYRLRVAVPRGQMIGAVIAAMAVQWTVARAVGCGVWEETLPFMRTAKGGATRKGSDFPAFWEAGLGALLLVGALVVVATNYKQIRELNIFALVLVVQSLPFLAAVAMAVLEGSRFNEFAYWRTVEATVAAKLPQPAAVAQTPVQLSADKHVETAQETPPVPSSADGERRIAASSFLLKMPITGSTFERSVAIESGSRSLGSLGCEDERRSPRQRRFDQLDPIRGADRDRFVVEIVGRVVKAGAVAVAHKNKRARTRFQHERKVLRAHDRRDIVVDALAPDHLRRNGGRERGLLLVVSGDGIVAPIGELRGGAIEP